VISVVVDTDIEVPELPDRERIQAAVRAVCQVMHAHGEVEVCIRFAGDMAVRELNRQWLGCDSVTDVLAFPAQDDPTGGYTELGDIILAWPFVRKEAARLGLAAEAHAMHLIVHATLHLFGLDHADAGERTRMHALERHAMHVLGLHDPYPEKNSVPTHA